MGKVNERVRIRVAPIAILMLGLAAIVGIALMSGCSGVQAKGDVSAAIDQRATVAAGQQASAQAGTLTPDAMRQVLKENATVYGAWSAGKTVSVFSYWFGKSTLYVNGDYAARIDKDNLLLQEVSSRAATIDPANLAAFVIREANCFLDLKRAKDGEKTPP